MILKYVNAASEQDLLKEELKRIQADKETLENRFNNCVDTDYIDSIIYEMKALESLYNYILDKVRRCERFEKEPVKSKVFAIGGKSVIRSKGGEQPVSAAN